MVVINPLHRFAIAFHEAHVGVMLGLQRIGTDCERAPSAGAALPRAMMRTLPSLTCCRPKSVADQPVSIRPDIAAVSMAQGAPVAVGLTLQRSSSLKPSTNLLVFEPLVE